MSILKSPVLGCSCDLIISEPHNRSIIEIEPKSKENVIELPSFSSNWPYDHLKNFQHNWLSWTGKAPIITSWDMQSLKHNKTFCKSLSCYYPYSWCLQPWEYFSSLFIRIASSITSKCLDLLANIVQLLNRPFGWICKSI